MRVAMNDGIGVKRPPPCPEQHFRNPVAHLLWRILKRIEPLPRYPAHGEQPVSGKVRDRVRHCHKVPICQHMSIKRHVLRLAGIVEFFAKPVCDLVDHGAWVDRSVHPLEQAEHGLELPDIRLHGARHVRILQLAGDLATIMRCGPMNLAERGSMGGLLLELGKLLQPSRAKFSPHAPLDEWPAHGRGLGLQLAEFVGIFRRQEIRNGRHHLRHFHEWPLGFAKRRRQRACDLLIALIPSKQALRGKGQTGAGQIGPDPDGSCETTRQAVAFRVSRCLAAICHGQDIGLCLENSQSALVAGVSPI